MSRKSHVDGSFPVVHASVAHCSRLILPPTSPSQLHTHAHGPYHMHHDLTILRAASHFAEYEQSLKMNGSCTGVPSVAYKSKITMNQHGNSQYKSTHSIYSHLPWRFYLRFLSKRDQNWFGSSKTNPPPHPPRGNKALEV